MSSKHNIAINQHYVPKFYLKEFSTDETYDKKNKQVYTYDKIKKEYKPRNTKTIASSKYLYSPKAINNNRDSYMEDKLAKIENFYLKQFGKILLMALSISIIFKPKE
jgi:hypothetical protein